MLCFRMPFSEEVLTVISDDAKKKAVQFVSFDGKAQCAFRGRISKFADDHAEQLITSAQLQESLRNGFEQDRDEYLKAVQDAVSFVREYNLPKLVLSRRKVVPFNGKELFLYPTFLNLCAQYPNAFVYAFIKDDHCWVGAFSELLGRFHKQTGQFETMSLAGTLPLKEEWSVKEIHEQAAVTDFVHDILIKYSDKVVQSGTSDHVSGNIKHLRTDFKAFIDAGQLNALIDELHPTPAVCGIPKDLCREAIAELESSPRSFYAGYIRVENEETVSYFVNLRCAQIFHDAAVLYVGGGVTAESSPDKEWQETELKAEAVLRNLAFN